MNNLTYARAHAATTLLANALARLWTTKRRTLENCVELAAVLRYTNKKVRNWLDEVGFELTDGQIEDAYWKIEHRYRTLEERVEANKDADPNP